MENQMSMGDQLLAAIRQTIEENIDNEKFSVSDLAEEVGLSRSALHRNLIKLTGKSPSDLITEIRLTRARELLENNSATVSEIAYNVGFTSASYFDKVFKKVYHITPGELRRKGSGKSTSSNKWKIASIISFVVIVGLIGLIVIPRSGKKKIIDKSVAVLPFINDSQDQGNEHFINGIMEELLIDLQSVKELRVPSRTSTEQYRNNPKSIQEIAKALKVSYLVAGSGQRYGDHTRLRVQLVDGKTGKTMWADSYDEVIAGTEDVFRIQRELAQSIAAELQAVITPEEMEIIEKIPTTNLTALTLYQKGRVAFQKYQLRHDSVDLKHDEVYYSFQKYQFRSDSVDLNHAEAYFQEALKQDPEFAKAYVGLAQVYWRKHYLESYFSGNFLDSVLITANTALSFDDKLSDAYFIRGSYYYQNGDLASAEGEFDKTIALNPNDWEAYYNKALLYQFNDLTKVLKNALLASSLYSGPRLSQILTIIYWGYSNAGFYNLALEYADKIYELDHDTANYYMNLAGIAFAHADYNSQLDYLLKAYTIDSNKAVIIFGHVMDKIADCYTNLGNYQMAANYYEKLLKSDYMKNQPNLWGSDEIGYVYWKLGDRGKAAHFFNKQIEYCKSEIELGRFRSEEYFAYYDLASVYAFLGEKEKALEYLKMFNRRDIIHSWMVVLVKTDPKLDSIRDEPEFQQIQHDVEVKFQAEHERVRQWLEQNELL